MQGEVAGQWVEDWLSAERFRTYLKRAGFDRGRALALHEWNAQLNAALLHDFAHLEVGLRNMYDRALGPVVAPGEKHWTDPQSCRLLFPDRDGADSKTHRDLANARRLAGGPKAPPGKLMAELTFGFWTLLTSTRHANAIWQPHLQHLYPSGSDRRQIHSGLDELRKLRNRVAHHEPVVLTELPGALRRFQRYSSYVSPELARYMSEYSSVEDLLKTRP
jgi:hypothetical protein